MSPPTRLEGARVALLQLSADALDALIAGDAERLEGLTGARFPRPLRPPPLMDDALPFMRDRLRAEPSEAGWWSWLVVDQATGEALGSLGLTGPPDTEGVVTLGYAIYPGYQGRGYATEGAGLLVAWALAEPGVSSVRATVPPAHAISLRVADKLGMRPVGTDHDPEVGEVVVLEVREDPTEGAAGPPRGDHRRG